MDGNQALSQVLFFGLLVVGLYVLAIRPQRARARALAEVRSTVAPGRRVITTAGIHATVLSVDEDAVVLEVAPGVPVRFVTAAVVRVLDDEAEEPAA